MEEEFKKTLQIIIDKPDISYSGRLDSNIVKKLTEQVEILVKDKYEKQFSQRKVYHTIVEMIQNIRRHGLLDLDEIASFKTKMFDSKSYILSENIISNEKSLKLIRNIKELNKIFSDFDKVKQLYKAKILGQGFPTDVIVEDIRGIGLIEIVRKSKNKILYNLEKIDDQNSKISLIATVDIN